MVVVTKANFIEQSNDFLNHLPTAGFIAIDEEMTGISVGPFQRVPKDDPPSKQYPRLKKAPETYSIIQLGVALFHYTGQPSNQQPSPTASAPREGDPDWTVRRYNFFCFPGKDSDRSVVLNPGAVAFLHQHNISFDKWTKEGIPFMTEGQSKESVQRYIAKALEEEANEQEQSKQPSVQEASQRRVRLRRTEDIDFFTRTMASLRSWLDSPVTVPEAANNNGAANPEGACFLLPDCNSFMRRALYESIGQEYPSLVLDKAPGTTRIRVWRLSDEEKDRREKRLKREAWENLIVERVGLFRIFHAISQVCRGFELERDSAILAASLQDVDLHKEASLYRGARNRKIPVVVHNGFMDLCFLSTHFIQQSLPDSLIDCKRMIHKYFPVVYDTKILASECSSMYQNNDTRLGPLYERVVTHIEGRIEVQTSQDTSAGADPTITSEEHFADYDAYMTGVCYLGICQNIHRVSDHANTSSGVLTKPNVGTLVHLLDPIDDPQVRKLFGRNLLHQMSMYSLDLEAIKSESDDPLCRGMNKSASYRVAGIPTSTNTRDIVNSVSGLVDRLGRPVNFEVVWLDDTSFIVAASCRHTRPGAEAQGADANEMLLEHGNLIYTSLKERFRTSTVMSLQQHLEEEEEKRVSERNPAPPQASMVSRMLSWIGIGANQPLVMEGPPTKKRRLD